MLQTRTQLWTEMFQSGPPRRNPWKHLPTVPFLPAYSWYTHRKSTVFIRCAQRNITLLLQKPVRPSSSPGGSVLCCDPSVIKKQQQQQQNSMCRWEAYSPKTLFTIFISLHPRVACELSIPHINNRTDTNNPTHMGDFHHGRLANSFKTTTE